MLEPSVVADKTEVFIEFCCHESFKTQSLTESFHAFLQPHYEKMPTSLPPMSLSN
jgi:hypothetical protein